MDFDALVARISRNWTPKSASEWLWADEAGWTVAHEVAKSRDLPADFPHWAVADMTGYTVAHVAAEAGRLADPEPWLKLRDHGGTSVAHVLARKGLLPPYLQTKDILILKDAAGTTVQHLVQYRVKDHIEEARRILKVA